MCFFKSVRTKHKTANVDTVCYKLMSSGFFNGGNLNSIFYPSFDGYNVGDKILPVITIPDDEIDGCRGIDGGVIYSYVSLKAAEAARIRLITFRPEKSGSVAIVSCAIPAGTSYWRNNRGEIISKQLVIKEILKI